MEKELSNSSVQIIGGSVSIPINSTSTSVNLISIEEDVPISPEIAINLDNSARIVEEPKVLNPYTLPDLLAIEYLRQAITQGYVFIQNRKESSDQLLSFVDEALNGLYEFKLFHTHIDSQEDILKTISNMRAGSQQKVKAKYPPTSRPKIRVIDLIGDTESINQLCIDLSLVNRKNQAIWVRGYINDLHPRVIQLFDVLFAYDMSEGEYDRLKTCISVNLALIEELKNTANVSGGLEPFLFFYNRKRIRCFPSLKRNPTIIYQAKEQKMDFSTLVPIVVEATRFLFNEASNWIAEKRKDSEKEQVAEKLTTKASRLDREAFSKLEANPDVALSMLDETALEVNAYRIDGLVKQIRTYHKNLTDLKGVVAEYGALVPNHIKRDIERQEEAINSSTQELIKLLSIVYRKDIDV